LFIQPNCYKSSTDVLTRVLFSDAGNYKYTLSVKHKMNNGLDIV